MTQQTGALSLVIQPGITAEHVRLGEESQPVTFQAQPALLFR